MKTIFHKLPALLILTAVLSLPSPSSLYAQDNIAVNFSGMTPHLNQTLYLRVIDKSTLKEAGRTSQQITASGFNVTLPVIEAGGSYFVDFFADHNSNGRYDAPPTDHAWRLELNNAKAGGDTLDFSHNASFVNIQWPYMLTVNFTGMDPHIGEMMELRVENNNDNREVGRLRVAAIPSPSFQIQVPGLQIGAEYKVEFYADFNNNGLYDKPPADHAWEITFTNSTGDVVQNFSHSAAFTDINWKYQITLNLKSMTPHLGQRFELRAVKKDNQEELERVSLPQILVSDFSVYIPEFELGHNYDIDFYADHNGNGVYDAPPADHAWRISFASSTGDFVQDFTHNTGFTDIQWPGTTDLNEDVILTSEFALEQNYPNPFNPVTRISWQSPVGSRQTLKVYDVLGNEVATLVDEYREAGRYEVEFQSTAGSRQLASGIYIYQLKAGGFVQTKKLMLMK